MLTICQVLFLVPPTQQSVKQLLNAGTQLGRGGCRAGLSPGEHRPVRVCCVAPQAEDRACVPGRIRCDASFLPVCCLQWSALVSPALNLFCVKLFMVVLPTWSLGVSGLVLSGMARSQALLGHSCSHDSLHSAFQEATCTMASWGSVSTPRVRWSWGQDLRREDCAWSSQGSRTGVHARGVCVRACVCSGYPGSPCSVAFGCMQPCGRARHCWEAGWKLLCWVPDALILGLGFNTLALDHNQRCLE